ncbi:MAG TPA: GNAT family N-acetyltransferase, partial [Steroidobacteraceae bacterium]|nr:GNAT family N-acetyltransferase [Steroidobacteraceae bacterium]
MRTRVVDTIAGVDRSAWNGLALGGSPFLRHEFLEALETTRCADPGNGWQPMHVLIEDAAGQLAAAVPLYLKSHSWGEFVFDWSWANAYARAGLDYYPKLVSAIPFTPAPGPRLLCSPSRDPNVLRGAAIAALEGLVKSLGVSSLHVLFTAPDDHAAFIEAGFLPRKDCQFHWYNRGYGSFDEYVETFRADKRKKLRRERRRIAEAGIRFETHDWRSLDARAWKQVHALTADTFRRRGHDHYLSTDFFIAVAREQPDAVMVKLAVRGGAPVAAAIFFVGADTLYGRYWGTHQDFHSLHFEACYYQGIDFCIERGLARFEPGTQGEHKIARGFEPTATWSAHWIAEPRFTRAIRQYLHQEALAVDAYMSDARRHLPFHRDLPAGSAADGP